MILKLIIYLPNFKIFEAQDDAEVGQADLMG